MVCGLDGTGVFEEKDCLVFGWFWDWLVCVTSTHCADFAGAWLLEMIYQQTMDLYTVGSNTNGHQGVWNSSYKQDRVLKSRYLFWFSFLVCWLNKVDRVCHYVVDSVVGVFQDIWRLWNRMDNSCHPCGVELQKRNPTIQRNQYALETMVLGLLSLNKLLFTIFWKLKA